MITRDILLSIARITGIAFCFVCMACHTIECRLYQSPSLCTGYLHEVAPVLLLVLVSEVFVDWTKHAFITKFNDISPDVYQEYRSILAKDLASSQRQQVLYRNYNSCSNV